MKQILCFGDSNTYGLIPENGGRYVWEERWTGILNDAVAPKGYRVIEEGLCGRTTVFDDPFRPGRNGAKMLPIILETHAPVDVMIVMLGTNDCKPIYDASAKVIGKGITVLLEQIAQKIPTAKILLVSPIALGERVWEDAFDPEFNRTSVQTAKELAGVYREIAEEKKIYFLDASQYAAPGEADREHLDKIGHQQMAKAIYEALEPLL